MEGFMREAHPEWNQNVAAGQKEFSPMNLVACAP